MSFIDYVKQRVKQNKNFLGIITGQTGSGKSYSALKFGESIDPDFNIDRVVFSPLEFMRIMKNGKLKPGSVIVFDEAGVGMSAQEWQSVQNKLINFVLQTFRHKNYVVLFTTPNFGFVASQSRKLFHCHMETVGIDHNNKVCRVKPLLIQINQRSGKMYYKYLRVKTDRGLIPIKRVCFSMASPELIAAYEEKKTDYTRKLNQDILAQLELKSSNVKPLTKKQEQVLNYLKDGLSIAAIADLLSVNFQSIYKHVDAIKNKGYEIKANKGKYGKVLSYEVTP